MNTEADKAKETRSTFAQSSRSAFTLGICTGRELLPQNEWKITRNPPKTSFCCSESRS